MFGKPRAWNLLETQSFVLPSLMLQKRRGEMVGPNGVTPSSPWLVAFSLGHKETTAPNLPPGHPSRPLQCAPVSSHFWLPGKVQVARGKFFHNKLKVYTST